MPNQILFPATSPSGTPVAQPVYLVDIYGNPISSTNAQSVTVANANPNGQTTKVNSAPVVLASDQWSISAPSIVALQGYAAAMNGTLFSATVGLATFTGSYAGLSIFNNSSAKNALILSLIGFDGSSGQEAQGYITTSNPALGTPVTPINDGSAAGASLMTCSYALGGLTRTGTVWRVVNGASSAQYDLINGFPHLLPAGAANGVTLYLANANTNVGSLNAIWLEY